MKTWDLIVVGSGHAGVEAAYSGIRSGLCSVLIVTMDFQKTAYMSCNPSIGGVGKGHIVREIDTLGGLMAISADNSSIQFKVLNSSKGPAVRGSRAQCDKKIYSQFVRQYMEQKVQFLSAEVKSLLIEKNKCIGVMTKNAEKIFAKAVILTTGTFMKGIMHIGQFKKSGGRVGEKATQALSDYLKNLGFKIYRLKTGTPPRLKKESIDFTKLQEQNGDKKIQSFSFFSLLEKRLPQVSCHITYTNEKTHEIIYQNLKLSALYSGAITGTGPRYCPSIEDKIIRFSDKKRHQSFLEPETINGNTIYLQGISTSLPAEIQLKFLRTIKGLERVEILQPGYAVEYDFLDPKQLFPTLETKFIKNLFLAGQINGSSGYEEAAGQGLVAGINAAHQVLEKQALILKRHESYIGVLIDDLVTKGTKEPYRMLTSRAEHRLVLREDNVIERLFPISQKYRIVSDQKLKLLEEELKRREELSDFLVNTKIFPNEKTNQSLKNLKLSQLRKVQNLKQFFCRPDVTWEKMKQIIKKPDKNFKAYTWQGVEIKIKYEGYIERQNRFIAQNQKEEDLSISHLDFNQVKGLSLEALEKLKEVKPFTLAQASRISGVSPSALQAILIHLKKQKKSSKKKFL